MKLCHTCEIGDIIFSDRGNPDEAKWIKREGLEPVPSKMKPSECRVHHPEKSDIEITLKTKLKPGTKILYWAANPKSLMKADEITSALYAYGRENGKRVKNMGCAKIKKDGSVVIKVISPQCYREKGTIWAKHVHFVKEKDDDWDRKNFYTVLGIPSETKETKTRKLREGGVYVTPDMVKRNWKKGKFTMVYALGNKRPSLKDLKGYEKLKQLEIHHSAKKFTIPRSVSKGEPLVFYCANKKCDASKELMKKFAERGYENLFYMDAGMEGFSDSSKKIFLESMK